MNNILKKIGLLRTLLIFLFILSIYLRTYYLKDNLFFGPEQGIDFLVIKDIALHSKFTLIGAKTDISGIFHGPIYYYLSVIPFKLSNGDPLFISKFFIILNSLSVFLIYLLGKELFNKRTGIIGSIVFTFSFGAIVYSRWLSSHPLSIPLSLLLFLFLNRFINGKKIYLLYATIVFGLLVQSALLNLLFFSITLLIILVIYNKKIRKAGIPFLLLCLLSISIFSLGNFILFDLRHDFLISKSLLSLITGSSGYYSNFKTTTLLSFSTFSSSFSNFIFPVSSNISTVILIFSLIFFAFKILKKGKEKNSFLLLFLWFVTTLGTLIILRHDVLYQYFVSSSVASLLIISLIIDKLWKRNFLIGFLALVIIISANFINWQKNIPVNKRIFFQSTQEELKYSDQIKVVDRIYKETNKEPFAFQSFTIPFWIQDGWKYLFWYYGSTKYGYLPLESGTKNLFVIIQKAPGEELFQKNWLDNEVSKWGKLQKTFNYGILTVQKLKTN